jgi:hypothetical protein
MNNKAKSQKLLAANQFIREESINKVVANKSWFTVYQLLFSSIKLYRVDYSFIQLLQASFEFLLIWCSIDPVWCNKDSFLLKGPER